MFLGLVVALILCQNFLAVGLADLLGISPMISLCTVHPLISRLCGARSAPVLGTLLALQARPHHGSGHHGLGAGSVMGGWKRALSRSMSAASCLDTVVPGDDSCWWRKKSKATSHQHVPAAAIPADYRHQASLAFVSKALAMTGLTFPIYIGAMIAAACMRNIGEFTHKFTTHMGEINDIGGISLSLFLGIAMITLKLWQLAALALPLIILLAGQTLLIFLFTYFVIFNIMGRDYDAAVIAAGVCGFGMGATPNAMANMQALCEKYAPSVKAYLLIPLVGSLFADFLNSLVITFFINFI